jgi:hypothetical protein
MRLHRDDLLHLIAICPQLAQHQRHLALHRNLAQALVRSQRRARTLAPQRMTG